MFQRALADTQSLASQPTIEHSRPVDASNKPLCLVGMSGVGKSYWAKRLAALGFLRHDCDELIAARLSELVQVGPGEEPVHALGRWMGMPESPGFAEREARYLALEEEVTREAVRAARNPGRHVLDTTGSVIYLSGTVLAELRQVCTVVCLRLPEHRRGALLQRFMAAPKPLVWAGAFEQAPGESEQEALARCYAKLLRTRDAQYLALAHHVLDVDALAARGDDAEAFLRHLQQSG